MLTTATSDTLLAGLMHGDAGEVWTDYVARYRPLLVRYARRFGMSDADAEDVAQDTLWAFARSYREGGYERGRGRLRSWLFGIAKNTLLVALRRGCRPEQQVDESADRTDFFARVPDDDHLQQEWERQWQQAVLRQCLDEIRAETEKRTMMAFEMFAREGLPAREVAARTGLSENAVFLAKRRVLHRIRELLPRIEEVF